MGQGCLDIQYSHNNKDTQSMKSAIQKRPKEREHAGTLGDVMSKAYFLYRGRMFNNKSLICKHDILGQIYEHKK